MSEDRERLAGLLARNAWELGYVAERSPAIEFADIRETFIVFRTAGFQRPQEA